MNVLVCVALPGVPTSRCVLLCEHCVASPSEYCPYEVFSHWPGALSFSQERVINVGFWVQIANNASLAFGSVAPYLIIFIVILTRQGIPYSSSLARTPAPPPLPPSPFSPPPALGSVGHAHNAQLFRLGLAPHAMASPFSDDEDGRQHGRGRRLRRRALLLE